MYFSVQFQVQKSLKSGFGLLLDLCFRIDKYFLKKTTSLKKYKNGQVFKMCDLEQNLTTCARILCRRESRFPLFVFKYFFVKYFLTLVKIRSNRPFSLSNPQPVLYSPYYKRHIMSNIHFVLNPQLSFLLHTAKKRRFPVHPTATVTIHRS